VIGQYASVSLGSPHAFSGAGIGFAYRNRRSATISPIAGFLAGYSTSGAFLTERAGMSIPFGNSMSMALEVQTSQLLKRASNESLPLTLSAAISYSW